MLFRKGKNKPDSEKENELDTELKPKDIMEKNDLLAMFISAILFIFLPVALLLGIFVLIAYLF